MKRGVFLLLMSILLLPSCNKDKKYSFLLLEGVWDVYSLVSDGQELMGSVYSSLTLAFEAGGKFTSFSNYVDPREGTVHFERESIATGDLEKWSIGYLVKDDGSTLRLKSPSSSAVLEFYTLEVSNYELQLTLQDPDKMLVLKARRE